MCVCPATKDGKARPQPKVLVLRHHPHVAAWCVGVWLCVYVCMCAQTRKVPNISAVSESKAKTNTFRLCARKHESNKGASQHLPSWRCLEQARISRRAERDQTYSHCARANMRHQGALNRWRSVCAQMQECTKFPDFSMPQASGYLVEMLPTSSRYSTSRASRGRCVTHLVIAAGAPIVCVGGLPWV